MTIKLFLISILVVFSNTHIALAKDDNVHRLVINVNEKSATSMHTILDNVATLSSHYAKKGEKLLVEVVAYGPGLHMLRADTSPVTKRLTHLSQQYKDVSFHACNNTITKMSKMAKRQIPLLSVANITPSGMIHVVKRTEEGWAYIHY